MRYMPCMILFWALPLGMLAAIMKNALPASINMRPYHAWHIHLIWWDHRPHFLTQINEDWAMEKWIAGIALTHWLVAWTAPCHYLKQCWNIVNWTLGNKLQWNFNRNSNIFIEDNTFENVVCEMLFISSWPQCVKWNVLTHPCPELNGDLMEPPWKTGNGSINTNHCFMW